MRSKKNKSKGYRYRVGENKDYVSPSYMTVTSVTDSALDVGKFLRENYVFTVSQTRGILQEVYNKEMVIIKSSDKFLEGEKPIYDKYKEEIDEIIYHNMTTAIEKYIDQGKTKIEVNLTTSGCDYDIKDESENLLGSKSICGLKTLYISWVSSNDKDLFERITKNFLSDSLEYSYEFLSDGNVLVISNNQRLILNIMAFNKMNEILNDYKNQKRGASKQLKLEG